MTLNEFLSMPDGMTLPEYEKKLAEDKRRLAKIRRLSNKIYDCIDALDVLNDEAGSDRWKSQNERLQDCLMELREMR